MLQQNRDGQGEEKGDVKVALATSGREQISPQVGWRKVTPCSPLAATSSTRTRTRASSSRAQRETPPNDMASQPASPATRRSRRSMEMNGGRRSGVVVRV